MNQKIIQLIATRLDPEAFSRAAKLDAETKKQRQKGANFRAKDIVAVVRAAGWDFCTAEERQILDSLP